MKTTLLLTVTHHDSTTTQHRMTGRSITLGSGEKAMIRIPGLQPLHAVLSRENGDTFWLFDLETQQVKHNGQNISKVVVEDGDSIRLAQVSIQVNIETVAQPTDPMLHPPPVGQDPLEFIMRSCDQHGTMGDDPHAAPVLEIAAIWRDVVMDVQHFHHSHPEVSIGSNRGHRWRMLGMPIAWVPSHFSKLAWLTAPSLCDVHPELQGDFFVPNLRHQVLVSQHNGQRFVHVHPQWDGFVDIAGQRQPLRAWLAQAQGTQRGDLHCVALPTNSIAVVDTGDVIFVIREVRAGRKVISALTDQFDYPFAGIMSFMGAAFLMLSTVLLQAPPPAETAFIDLPDHFAEVFVQTLEQPPTPVMQSNEPQRSPLDEGERAAGEEGRVGKRDAHMPQASGQRTERINAQERDRDIAMNAGVLGALSDNGALDNLFGSSALTEATSRGIGGLYGAQGVQIGVGGLGGRGDSLGGGGRLVEGGGLGTRGRGGGDSTYGNTNGGEKIEGRISAPNPPIILGSLDKRLIDDVVKQHMNQIRYCYQRELNKDAALGGKVVVRFVIAADGSVSKSTIKSSSMGSDAVEQCISQRFLRFQFPAPAGGGIVIVSYPFMFAPG